MDFYEFERARKDLAHIGVVPLMQGDAMRFEFDASLLKETTPVSLSICCGTPPTTDHDRTIVVDRERLPALCEEILHSLKLDEAMLIPHYSWGTIVNIAAFDLVDNDSWLQIDAEASMHQNKRDPLEIGPQDFGFIPCLYASLLEHGESEEADMNLLTLGAPIIVDLLHTGTVVVTCGSAGLLDTLLDKNLGGQ
ncbi:MAG: hypothetical protein ACYTF7_08535 [Planctomycetota bacterium]